MDYRLNRVQWEKQRRLEADRLAQEIQAEAANPPTDPEGIRRLRERLAHKEQTLQEILRRKYPGPE